MPFDNWLGTSTPRSGKRLPTDSAKVVNWTSNRLNNEFAVGLWMLLLFRYSTKGSFVKNECLSNLTNRSEAVHALSQSCYIYAGSGGLN